MVSVGKIGSEAFARERSRRDVLKSKNATICGDCCIFGALASFCPWCTPCTSPLVSISHQILGPGNHDRIMTHDRSTRS
jgi:hypothetical protein